MINNSSNNSSNNKCIFNQEKIITIISTRPELIRLSVILKKIDNFFGIKNHIIIYTGQNYTKNLYNYFLKNFKLRKPNYEFNLEKKLYGVNYESQLIIFLNNILKEYNNSVNTKILILGDTTGAFYSSYISKRLGLKIYHLEAGNRCFSDTVPEEINRKLIDKISYKLLCYTQKSKENLLAEKFDIKDIFVVGNPIYEVIEKNINENIEKNINENNFDILITLHRTENLNNKIKLKKIINQIHNISKKYNVLFLIHPKLKDVLKKYNINIDNKKIQILESVDFSTFINLEKQSKLVITDSGTVPEECAILNKPCVLIRDNTERPELLEYDQMIVLNPLFFQSKIINYMKYLEKNIDENKNINFIPEEYKKPVGNNVIKILMGDL